MTSRRVRRMGVGELWSRGRQEAFKWLDRLGEPTGHERYGRTTAVGSFDHFDPTAGERFFEGATNEHTAAWVAECCPEARDKSVAVADAVCQGRFDMLGYRGLSFGEPIDWRRDPISGRRSPLVHWSRLDPLDVARIGDSKVIWELNRHQWLVHLGQAYCHTKDQRYAEVFAAHIRAWLRANPRGLGINWASSLEVALRLIAWCWSLFLFRGSTALSPKLVADMVSAIAAHASHVERYLSYYFSPNTHLTGEALGLYYAGTVFPELAGAKRWRALGRRILVDESERQILPDGVHFELATCYHCYTIEIYLHLLVLAARHGEELPTVVSERVTLMLDFLLALRRPDGGVPQIGDADGGWLLPLTTRTPDDVRGLFSTAAVLFRRRDYAWAAGSPAPETLWLLGPASLAAFEACDPSPPAEAPSRLFRDGGYVVMRNGWQTSAHQLIFDVGRLGCPVSAGHGHADLLGVQCSVFGEPYIVDAGTYCYTADPEWREFFRSTAAHSTVMVDGHGQAIPAGAFSWRVRPKARLNGWRTLEDFDLADAEHDAYRRLADPVRHRRRVLFVKPSYWILVDDVDGMAEHQIEVRFQFGPIHVNIEPTQWVRARGRDGNGLLIRSFATLPLTAEVIEGGLARIQGWISPNYGDRQPAPMLVYRAVTHLPLRIVTVLLPTENPSAAPPAILFTHDALVFEEGDHRIRFDDRDVFIERNQNQAAL